MHVLFLNQTFHPDVAATAQHLWDLARHLDAHGHRVTVVTSKFLYGTDQPIEPAHERIGGNIDVHRLAGTGLGKRSLITRLADFGSFYAAAAAKLAQLPAPDVILALTTPPMISALAGLQRHFRRRADDSPVRFVYYVMDVYPDAAVASGLFGPTHVVAGALRHVTADTLDAADAVIALGRDMRDLLVRQYPRQARPQKIHVIPPWADGGELTPLAKLDNPLARELGVADTFNIVYSGNLGVAHDVETMLGAMERMTDDAGTAWLFIGGGKRMADVKRRAEDAKWRHVRFLPYQPREQLNASLNLADVHLVSQLPAFTGVVVPSKLFGILAVGKPSVMIGPADAECSRVIAENDAGVVVPNGDVDGLVTTLRTLRETPERRAAMGRAARAALERHFDCRIACQRIEDLLVDVSNR